MLFQLKGLKMNSKNLKRQTVKAILATSIILFMATSCAKKQDANSSTQETAQTDTEEKAIGVNAARVAVGTIDSSIQVGGTVSSGNAVAIIGEASGTLRNFSLELGDKVVEDQIIGQIDPSRPGMQYKMKDVKAPITGTIVKVSTEEGSTVGPGVPLAYVEDLKDLKIKANIIEKYISQIKTGENVEITFDAYQDRIFKGKVTDVDPTVNSQTRSLGITIEFEDPKREILPGMYANNQIITKTITTALLIPSTAVFAKENQFYVYIINDNKVSRKTIEKGLETYENVQVTAGLNVGDIVVTTKSSLLGEGSTVSVKNEGAF
jgi:multidrug efflux pump subunit AcrA (membrane-fusion protein)